MRDDGVGGLDDARIVALAEETVSGGVEHNTAQPRFFQEMCQRAMSCNVAARAFGLTTGST